MFLSNGKRSPPLLTFNYRFYTTSYEQATTVFSTKSAFSAWWEAIQEI